MLILGGGIIGLEMATIYNALRLGINIVEMFDSLMAGLIEILLIPIKNVSNLYENIWLNTKVTKVEAKKDGIYVTMEDKAGKAKTEKLILYSLR